MNLIFNWLHCLRRGHQYKHIQNIYGDEILMCGGKRSVWKCQSCGAYEWRSLLHVEPSELEAMRVRKDAAYEERNKVVAALAKLFPSGVARTAIEGWSEDWHGCVYIDLPTGQASWHFHDSQAHLFAGLPPYRGVWDGHDTEEKYRRLAALETHASPSADNVSLSPNETSGPQGAGAPDKEQG